MKYLCIAFVLIFSLIGFAQDDPMRAVLEVDDLYTLKLTINHLYRGFAYDNSQEVLSRMADTYEEGGRTYNSNDYSSRVQDIFSQKSSIAGDSELDLKLFFKPLNFDIKVA